MTDEERKNLIATWGDKALRDKFEVNPYGLTQEELETLQSYDKLEVKVERLVRDVLVQKALKNSSDTSYNSCIPPCRLLWRVGGICISALTQMLSPRGRANS